MTSILLTALGIGLLIAIHEFGHFLAARMAGVRVLVFSIGFGPRLWSRVRKGTLYQLAAVPFGGYVRVAGDDPLADRDGADPDDLRSKSFLQRLWFFSGGVVMNLLLAIVLFPIVYGVGKVETAPVIGHVMPGGAAWIAAMRPGDRVLEVNGKPIRSFEELRHEVVFTGNNPLELRVERDGDVLLLEAEPIYSEARGFAQLGVEPAHTGAPLVIRVHDGSAAARAGLRTGDVLVGLDGPLDGVQEYSERVRALASRPPGEVTVTVMRDGEEHAFGYVPDTAELPAPRLGVVLGARRLAAIRPGSRLVERLGLRPGDTVVEVAGEPVADAEPTSWRPDGDGVLRLAVRRGDAAAPLSLSAAATADEIARLDDHLAFTADTESFVVAVQEGSPAATAGIRDGDRIVAVGGTDIADWDSLVEQVRGAAAGPLEVVVERGGERLALHAEPLRTTVDLGFLVDDVEIQSVVLRGDGVLGALAMGWESSIGMVRMVVVTLKRMFTGDIAATNLSGPVGIATISYHFAERGLIDFLWLMAALSVNLAVLNFLPIPVLDGGHVLFLVIEKIKGSPVSEGVFGFTQLVGMVFILFLLVFVTYNDIVKLL